MPLINNTPFITILAPTGNLLASDLRTGFFLSNNNLTLTRDGTATGVQTIRADVPLQSSGKYYYEFTLDTVGATGQTVNNTIGIIDDTLGFNNTSATNSGSQPSGGGYIGKWSHGGTEIFLVTNGPAFSPLGSTVILTGQSDNSILAGRTLGLEIDLDGNSFAVVDSVLTLGPHAINTGSYKPVIMMSNAVGYKVTVNFGASAYFHGLPSGFSNWPV